jgi:hypothetical protein
MLLRPQACVQQATGCGTAKMVPLHALWHDSDGLKAQLQFSSQRAARLAGNFPRYELYLPGRLGACHDNAMVWYGVVYDSISR